MGPPVHTTSNRSYEKWFPLSEVPIVLPTVQGKYRTNQMEWGMRIYKELLQQKLEKTLVHCMKNKIKQGSNAIIESSKQRV